MSQRLIMETPKILKIFAKNKFTNVAKADYGQKKLLKKYLQKNKFTNVAKVDLLTDLRK